MRLLACCTCWSGHPAARGNEVLELRTPDSMVIPRVDGYDEVHRIARRENGTYALACGDVWTHAGLVAQSDLAHSLVYEILPNKTFAIYVAARRPSYTGERRAVPPSS